MAGGKITDEIYKKYFAQIDAVLEATGNDYAKTAGIVSWFYGGSVERWRHVLKGKKGKAMPNAVKEFLKLNKK